MSIYDEADRRMRARDVGGALEVLETIRDAGGSEPALFLRIAALTTALGRLEEADLAISRALAADPVAFEPLMMRGALLERMGRADEAALTYGRALANAPEPLAPRWAAPAERGRARYRDWQLKTRDALRAVAAAADGLTPGVEGMIDHALRLVEAGEPGPTHYRFPGIRAQGYWDHRDWPWAEELERASDAIAAEYRALWQARQASAVPYIDYPDDVPIDQWADLNRSRDWSVFHLISRGVTDAAVASACPTTMAMLAKLGMPVIAGAGPNAVFSILAPRTHIPPHRGITNARLLIHLPLILPAGCWLRVGEERREWCMGEAWVFDDSFEHEAMNPSDETRVILIADIWHPDLSEADRRGVAAVIGGGGQIHGW